MVSVRIVPFEVITSLSVLHVSLHFKRSECVSVLVNELDTAVALSVLLLWREGNHDFSLLARLYDNVVIECPDALAARNVSVDLDSFL